MATWDRYTGNQTSFEVESWVGSVFTPRFFCDDPAALGVTYLEKPPVCKLKLTPAVQFVNTNIAWDASESGSATGTIDTFDIEWGGATDIGDLTAQDWASDPKTGNVQFTGTGIYTVTFTVTDTLGIKSAPCKTQVWIVDYVNLQRLYIATTDGGVYILTPASGPDAANTGLSGNDLNIRSLRLHPAYKSLPVTQHHLWACTEAGLIYSTDGAATWILIPKANLGAPANDAGDSPAPVTGDLDQIDVAFDPQDAARVYLTRTTATRTWLYYSDDYGVTWSNEQVSA